MHKVLIRVKININLCKYFCDLVISKLEMVKMIRTRRTIDTILINIKINIPQLANINWQQLSKISQKYI